MNQHRKYQNLIKSYLLGTLSAEKRHELERHLAECERCREKVEQTRQLIDTIAASVGTLKPEPGSFDRVRQKSIPKLSEYKVPSPKSSVPRPWHLVPKLSRWVYSTAGIVVVVAVVLTILITNRWSSFTSIQVERILGEGIQMQSGTTHLLIPIAQQTTLSPGDTFITDSYSQVMVTLNKSVKVWQNRATRITFLRNASVDISRGELFIAIGKPLRKFRVQTPAGDIQVTGTEFLVNVDTAKLTTVTCIKGVVTFSNPFGRQEILPGEQSLATPGQSPGNQKSVDTSQMLDWKQQFDRYSVTANLVGPDWYPVYWYSKEYSRFKNPYRPGGNYSGAIVNTADEVYTMDTVECKTFEQQGYIYCGIPFYFSRISSAHSVPIHRIIMASKEQTYGMVTIHYWTGFPGAVEFNIKKLNCRYDGILGYAYMPAFAPSKLFPAGVSELTQFEQIKFDAKHLYTLSTSTLAEQLIQNSEYRYFLNEYFTSPDGKLPSPKPFIPLDNARLTYSTVTLYWVFVPEAATYQVQLSTTARFDTVLQTRMIDVSSTVFQLPTGTWYWRVRTQSNYGVWGEFEEPTRFTILPAT